MRRRQHGHCLWLLLLLLLLSSLFATTAFPIAAITCAFVREVDILLLLLLMLLLLTSGEGGAVFRESLSKQKETRPWLQEHKESSSRTKEFACV